MKVTFEITEMKFDNYEGEIIEAGYGAGETKVCDGYQAIVDYCHELHSEYEGDGDMVYYFSQPVEVTIEKDGRAVTADVSDIEPDRFSYQMLERLWKDKTGE